MDEFSSVLSEDSELDDDDNDVWVKLIFSNEAGSNKSNARICGNSCTIFQPTHKNCPWGIMLSCPLAPESVSGRESVAAWCGFSRRSGNDASTNHTCNSQKSAQESNMKCKFYCGNTLHCDACYKDKTYRLRLWQSEMRRSNDFITRKSNRSTPIKYSACLEGSANWYFGLFSCIW